MKVVPLTLCGLSLAGCITSTLPNGSITQQIDPAVLNAIVTHCRSSGGFTSAPIPSGNLMFSCDPNVVPSKLLEDTGSVTVHSVRP